MTMDPTWERATAQEKTAVVKKVGKRGFQTLTMSVGSLQALPSSQPADTGQALTENGSVPSPRAENGAALEDCWQVPGLTDSGISDLSDSDDEPEAVDTPAHVLSSIRFDDISTNSQPLAESVCRSSLDSGYYGSSNLNTMDYNLGSGIEYQSAVSVENAGIIASNGCQREGSVAMSSHTCLPPDTTSQYSNLKRKFDTLDPIGPPSANQQEVQQNVHTAETLQLSTSIPIEACAGMTDITQDYTLSRTMTDAEFWQFADSVRPRVFENVEFPVNNTGSPEQMSSSL